MYSIPCNPHPFHESSFRGLVNQRLTVIFPIYFSTDLINLQTMYPGMYDEVSFLWSEEAG